MNITRRLVVAAAIALTALVPTTTHAVYPTCNEVQVIYDNNGIAHGGEAWCAPHAKWRAVAGFATTRWGTARLTRYGPWNSRYESSVFGTSAYPYARWVTFQVQG